MENYIYGILAILAALGFTLRLMRHSKVVPTPDSKQPVIDRNNREWIYFRALRDGNFLFRSPEGKLKSLNIDQMKLMGFLDQFDFEAVQK